MELQIMLSDVAGLADLQQQVRQQNHQKDRVTGGYSQDNSLYRRASPLSPEDTLSGQSFRRKRIRPEEQQESRTLPSAVHHQHSSGGEGSSGPEDVYSPDPMFEWPSQGGEGMDEGKKNECCGKRRLPCEHRGLEVVAAAAEEAMTSLTGRKRKGSRDEGSEGVGGKSCCREGAECIPRPMSSQQERSDSKDNVAAVKGAAVGAAACGRAATGGATSSHGGATNSAHNGWHVDDIDDNLAADLDGSLSGLEVDLTSSSSSYHMSESLLSLPTLTVFKQEVLSPTSQNDAGCRGHPPTTNLGSGNEEACGDADSPKQDLNSPTTGLQMSSEQQEQRNGLHMLHYDLCNDRGNGNPVGQMGASMDDDGNLGNGRLRRDDVGGSGSFDGMAIGARAGLGSNDMAHLERLHLRFEKSSNAESSEPVEDSRFQYVLAAATSIATKVNEETLTYLNQGQSYEIKLKKLGDLLAYRGKIFKSIIRICFHERRLQYAEREQLAAWQQSRPGDRVLEVDVPLSYGACEIVQDPCALNAVEFLWDPTKEVGVYIKVNCISTEFTPKKHGGEKGVPFRIQVETYSQPTATPGESQKKTTPFNTGKRLHAGACQIKVFKLKGADRKHKQDREKILKRPPSEQEKYQPSYECTVLNDIHADSVYLGPLTFGLTSSTANGGNFSPTDNSQNVVSSQNLVKEEGSGSPVRRCITTVSSAITLPSATPLQVIPDHAVPHHQSPSAVVVPALSAPISTAIVNVGQDALSDIGMDDFSVNMHPSLISDSSAVATAQWLRSNRFSPYLHTFASFSGADLLRLSRDDLIQICGLADGIRLFNALHLKTIAPRLTLYICLAQGGETGLGVEGVDGCGKVSSVFHAIYLMSASCRELSTKVAQIAGVSHAQLHDVFVQGPSGVHVLLTDDVVQNLPDDSLFSVDVIRGHPGERFRLLLKPASR